MANYCFIVQFLPYKEVDGWLKNITKASPFTNTLHNYSMINYICSSCASTETNSNEKEGGGEEKSSLAF